MTRRTRFLIAEYPGIAAQWHPTLNTDLDLSLIGPGSHRTAFWQCDRGHVWEAKVHSRVAGSGCPQCAGYVPRGRVKLSDRAPHLVNEWHPRNDVSPDSVGPGSQHKAWWLCPAGHEYQARVSNRSRGTGCPTCARAGRNVPAGLLSGIPELFAQIDPDAAPADVAELLVNSRVRLGWRCTQGHRWEAQVYHRAIAGSGCPRCAGKRRSPALPQARPDLAAEWHPDRNDAPAADTITAGSHRVVWWKCAVCAGEFRAKVFHRVRGLAKCPTCTGRVRYQPLKVESPEIAALWHPRLNGALTPAEVTAGANVPVWWLCPAGHEPWSAQVAHVFMGRQGCPRCRKRTHVSRQETELFAELQHVLPSGEQQYPLRAAQARFRLDMLFPSEDGRAVVVEFDGSYWHRDAEKRDRLKAEAIERHQPGWVVVRVREEPLQLTRNSDVLVPLLTDPFTAASIVIEHLMALTAWPEETRQHARAYLKGGRRMGAALAQRLITEHRSAASPDERSVPLPSSDRIEGVQAALW
ncbi:zinc-ribbon domain-containing protein [Streptomyces luteogriseus]|uniref:zinc-ribbon domain-containing protein n=1 Tax=Streptomyces luteogriseus TaxID=68233 RepID=UPI002E373CE4|nr:zinc-ribbon domain-containing protein [Streptomyces luteogriseus]WTJ25590.1 zinc-ribbon domain-containing protein [Streptomyces luteogriseus]WTJ33022.1 zinc-ribbon domain-containing protein [Streptomyces luteogriseus]